MNKDVLVDVCVRSVAKLIKDALESIRKILQDMREAEAVTHAKLSFRGLILRLQIFLKEDDEDTLTKLNMLEIELAAATTKEDISKLVKKLSDITGKKYP
jgi:hypothetical protein